jgi:hypothetical protein
MIVLLTFPSQSSSDNGIREYVIDHFPNGQYMHWICRCGHYSMSPDGDTRCCPIKSVCRYCFESVSTEGEYRVRAGER